MNSYNRIYSFHEKFNQSAFYFFKALPYPHDHNCLHSMKRVDMVTIPSILSAVLLIDWNNGFAPYSYYQNLYNDLCAGKIKMKYDDTRN